MSDLSPFVKTRARRRTLRLLAAAATAGAVASGAPALGGTASAAAGGAGSGVAALSGMASAGAGGVALGVPALSGEARTSATAGIGCDVAAAYYDTAPQSGNIAMVRQAVLCLIDAERAAAGLRPLTRNSALDAAAASHADAAARLKWWRPGANSHTNPQTGSTPGSRITAAGYCPNPLSWAYAETTYTGWGGSGTPRAAVHWWVHVSTYGHRQIVLSPTLVDVGAGAAAGAADPAGAGAGGGGTFVVDFGRCQR
ncbi:CAP domain-containing protein [Nonomuraea sp. NPDC050202]|uniref:CAP domain-containing protein n=1 Tax=Nonomuraea sp. NPDC050202 TaxID=3155035 RepID=UPI003411E99F